MKMADHIRSLGYKRIAVRENSRAVSENFARMWELQRVPLVMVRDGYYLLHLGVSQIKLRDPVLTSASYGGYLEWLLSQENIRQLAGKLSERQLLPALSYILQAFATEPMGERIGEVQRYLEDEVEAQQWWSQSDFDLESYLTRERIARGRERVEQLSGYGLELLERYGGGEIEQVCVLADSCALLELPEVQELCYCLRVPGEAGHGTQPGEQELSHRGNGGYSGYRNQGKWEELAPWQWWLPPWLLAYKQQEGELMYYGREPEAMGGEGRRYVVIDARVEMWGNNLIVARGLALQLLSGQGKGYYSFIAPTFTGMHPLAKLADLWLLLTYTSPAKEAGDEEEFWPGLLAAVQQQEEIGEVWLLSHKLFALSGYKGSYLRELQRRVRVVRVEIGREGAAAASNDYDAVYRVNWPEKMRRDGARRRASVARKPGRPPAIPLVLWQACWREDYFDFSVTAWEEQEVEPQIAYSRAYQQWYAHSKRLALEKNIGIAGVDLPMRLVPPGRYWMGSAPDEAERDDDELRHRVLLTQGYYLGKYAVTQAQWQAVMGNNPAHFKESGLQAPVEKVSWQESAEFCKQTGLKLPTEAQWEYACRAGTTTAFNLGDNIIPAQVNYDGNYPYKGAARGEYRGKTVTVGSMGHPNAWGLHEMHGNVWEWCQDWYDSSYYSIGENNDPQGPSTGSSWVLRGGSFILDAGDCRSAYRGYVGPGSRHFSGGVRVAAQCRTE